MILLTPRRVDRPEILDGPDVAPAALAANLADLRALNLLLGGHRAALRAAMALLARGGPGPSMVLDLATGSGDLALALARRAARARLALTVVAADIAPPVLSVARRHTDGRLSLICHDARRAPYADQSFDLVLCAQALHHMPDQGSAIALLRELARLARRGVIVSDLRRSWAAYLGARAIGPLLRSPISRHDGPLSALRAFTIAEARDLLRAAGLRGEVHADGPLRLLLTITP